MAKPKKIKRKLSNYLIDKNIQLRLTFNFIFITAFLTTLIGIMLIVGLWPILKEYVPQEIITSLQKQVFFSLYSVFIPLLLVIAGFCIVFTHRIAGPLYNIKNKIQMAIKGEEIEIIRLREGDEFHDFAAKINVIIQRYKENLESKN